MTQRFDPTRAIVFDLARGQLRDGEGVSRLNLPSDLLLRLYQQAPAEAAVDFGRSLGAELGRRVSESFGEAAESESVDVWTEHLGGQLALVGLGNLRVERWGKGLVLRVEGSPPHSSQLLKDVLSGALQRGLSKEAALVDFEDEQSIAYLVLSTKSAALAQELVNQGHGLGSVIENLHQGAA